MKLLTTCNRGVSEYDEKGLTTDGMDFVDEVDTMGVDLLHRMAAIYLMRRGDTPRLQEYVASHSGYFGPASVTFEQLIQLRMNYESTGSLTSAELDDLADIAHDTTLYNGMAYSLYYEVTDSLLDRSWEPTLEGRNTKHQINTTDIDSWVYPNPVQGNTLYFTDVMHGDLFLLDITGRKVYSDKLSGESKVRLEQLKPGIYLLSIIDNQAVRKTAKIIIQ